MGNGKSTVVIADRLLCDGRDVGDHVKVTLPDITWKKDTLTGAGIGGDIDVPLVGLAEAMNAQIDLRSISADNAAILFEPGIKKLEVRFNQDRMMPDSSLKRVNTKVFMTALSAGISNGSVQRGNAAEGNIKLSVHRIRRVEDGNELYLFDPAKQTLRVNGKDYSNALQI